MLGSGLGEQLQQLVSLGTLAYTGDSTYQHLKSDKRIWLPMRLKQVLLNSPQPSDDTE